MKQPSQAARNLAKKKAGSKNGAEEVINMDNGPRGRFELSNDARKAGEDARKRAKKYGTVTGQTRVSSYPTDSAYTKDVDAATVVESKRGNYYRVNESKSQNIGAADTNRKTFINPSYSDGNPRREFKGTPYPKKKK